MGVPSFSHLFSFYKCTHFSPLSTSTTRIPLTGICPFGLAHVDSPKGNLDGSTSPVINWQSQPVVAYDLLGTTSTATTTTEMFPLMQDSEGKNLTNTAHWYMECSNKGLCDRKAGLCKCFTGYEGHSCQRGRLFIIFETMGAMKAEFSESFFCLVSSYMFCNDSFLPK